MRAVVTGGLGFIGSALCAELARAGAEVICVDDLSAPDAPSRRRLLAAAGVRVIDADAGGARSLSQVSRADTAFHLAAFPGVRSRRPRQELWRCNVRTAAAVARAAAEGGTRCVLASTSSVYGSVCAPAAEAAPPSPRSPYARSKLAAEEAWLALGGDAVVTRLFTVYGPGQRRDMAFAAWIEALRSGSELRWCAHPRAARDFTYVDDAVAGLIAAAERGRAGATYNIAAGEPRQVSEALALIERECGVRARLAVEPPSRREAVSTAGCTRRAAAELGFRATTRLEDGIAAQVHAAGLRVPAAA